MFHTSSYLQPRYFNFYKLQRFRFDTDSERMSQVMHLVRAWTYRLWRWLMPFGSVKYMAISVWIRVVFGVELVQHPSKGNYRQKTWSRAQVTATGEVNDEQNLSELFIIN